MALKLTDEQLVERFVAIALEQDYVERMDEPVSEYKSALRSYGRGRTRVKIKTGDGRHALIALLDHDNAHVRLKAAIATLALAPEAARATLQALSDRNRPPEAGDARGLLRALEEGRYNPT